jgi:serine/threonine protein kinase
MRIYKEVKSHGGQNHLYFCEREDGTRYVIKYVHESNFGGVNEIVVTTSCIHPCIIRAVSVTDIERKFAINEIDFLGKNFFDFYMQNQNKKWSVVLPYVEKELITELKNLSQEQIIKYLIQIASAMKNLHDFGVYHMDLKLDNIMIDCADNVKIIDFDTCEFYNKFGYVSTPSLKCTITHRPPEAYDDDETFNTKFFNEKFDIWSFGIIVFELFSKRPMHLYQGLPSYSSVSKFTYEDIFKKLIESENFHKNVVLTVPYPLDRCLSLDPSKRPSWSEILQILEKT